MRLLESARQQPPEARLLLGRRESCRCSGGTGAVLPAVRGRCALGLRAAVPGEGSSEREGAAGARQVEPWGAAAAMANLGLGERSP